MTIVDAGRLVECFQCCGSPKPNPFSDTGTTEPVQNTDVEASEQRGEVVLIEESVTINDLVRGLNAIGVTPRDLIIILQSIRAAGALPADLELI